jgi:uncharacterized metal-binding protein
MAHRGGQRLICTACVLDGRPENQFETMCHPTAQAQILDDPQMDSYVLLCLCVGHDSPFLRHTDALCTVLAAKDWLLAHSPLGAQYLS